MYIWNSNSVLSGCDSRGVWHVRCSPFFCTCHQPAHTPLLVISSVATWLHFKIWVRWKKLIPCHCKLCKKTPSIELNNVKWLRKLNMQCIWERERESLCIVGEPDEGALNCDVWILLAPPDSFLPLLPPPSEGGTLFSPQYTPLNHRIWFTLCILPFLQGGSLLSYSPGVQETWWRSEFCSTGLVPACLFIIMNCCMLSELYAPGTWTLLYLCVFAYSLPTLYVPNPVQQTCAYSSSQWALKHYLLHEVSPGFTWQTSGLGLLCTDTHLCIIVIATLSVSLLGSRTMFPHLYVPRA